MFPACCTVTGSQTHWEGDVTAGRLPNRKDLRENSDLEIDGKFSEWENSNDPNVHCVNDPDRDSMHEAAWDNLHKQGLGTHLDLQKACVAFKGDYLYLYQKLQPGQTYAFRDAHARGKSHSVYQTYFSVPNLEQIGFLGFLSTYGQPEKGQGAGGLLYHPLDINGCANGPIAFQTLLETDHVPNSFFQLHHYTPHTSLDTDQWGDMGTQWSTRGYRWFSHKASGALKPHADRVYRHARAFEFSEDKNAFEIRIPLKDIVGFNGKQTDTNHHCIRWMVANSEFANSYGDDLTSQVVTTCRSAN